MSFSRTAYFLILAAVLLAGLGRIAILPPFEGVDETAHYSRILAAAFPPEKAADAERIDRGVFDYYPRGPMSEGWLHNATMHKKDKRLKGKLVADGIFPDYHVFFTKPAMVAEYGRLYRAKDAPRGFTASPEDDWQYQHPPPYYLLFGFVCRLLPDMTLAGRLFALRGFGYLLACAGLALGLCATARHLGAAGRKDAMAVAAFGAFTPFIMPAFFNDVARLGNDTLALFMFGIMWTLLLRHLGKPDGWKSWVPLGLALGAAALVKVTMLPPALGILLFLGVRGAAREGWRGLAIPAGTGLLAAAVCGAWYAPYFLERVHSAVPSGFSVFSGTKAHALPLTTMFSFAFESVFGAIVYFSDWYAFRLPLAFKVTAGLAPFWALAAWLFTDVRKKGLLSAEALPLWAASPLLGAVAVHSVFSGLTYGPEAPATAAYYAHILAPAFALCLGLGLAALRDGRGLFAGRDIAAVLGLLSLASAADLFWRQARMYGGCWWEDKALKKVVTAACDSDPLLLFRHLEVLAWPGVGTACFAAGFLCAAAGFGLILMDGRPSRDH